ncbi:MAG: ABC transporter substrate-binding protein [Alkalispirochaetaceae bacterium]
MKPARFLILPLLAVLILACAPREADDAALDSEAGEPGLDGGPLEGVRKPVTFTEPETTDALSVELRFDPPESLNPWRDPSDIETLLFPRTVRRDPETLAWVPWMAESWTFYEDRRGVEVTIRPGAFWSSGEEVSARDWVEPANRYFRDPGLRSPYREDPRFAGLEARWLDLGPRRFAIVVSRATDRATLLELMRVPPLPPGTITDEAGGELSTQQLNTLWRLEVREGNEFFPGRIAGDLPASAGAYELEDVERGGRLFRLSRREEHRDVTYGVAAGRQLTLRYTGSPEGAQESGSAQRPPADLLISREPGSRSQHLDEGLSPLLSGSDLTPAVAILHPDLGEAGALRSALVEGRASFIEALGEQEMFVRRYPATGDPSVIAPWLSDELPGAEATAGTAGGVTGSRPGGEEEEQRLSTDPDETAGSLPGGNGEPEARSLRILTTAEEDLLAFGEHLTELLAGQGYTIESSSSSREGLAEALISGEGWDIILLELSEHLDPHLGDPLLGNLLPLTGEWSRIATGEQALTFSLEPLTPGELSLLSPSDTTREEATLLLLRLWGNITLSERETDRRRAVTAYQELWDRFQPWVYLFDRSRRHYAADLGNLLFRHLPGASLGEVLPLIYREGGS